MHLLIPAVAAGLFALWMAAIAILAVQNATPASLQFFVWQSIQIPIGVILAFSLAMGLLGGSLLIALLAFERSQLLPGADDDD
ncbi:hypothetical protein DO97_15890 [Neosynechococcus sphagnicola sy1]|uniref:Lipopolysaccharide assembly protein A domain-containing protein n=1 Tax=Neosynechococcus sphagnicola sy1 TaxID=1497020 RepID=A0A098TI97_9CYAN|nr:LapA family protein [Neosynechococcus sphagnicola]KGF71756.1 hypothetical protein DO97_15890 [Neosynechococcus sphagnicola sy1]